MNFLTKQQVAELLGVSPDTVMRWCNPRKTCPHLKCFRGGHRTVRFTQADVETFVERRKR